jgi:hypothetical protein
MIYPGYQIRGLPENPDFNRPPSSLSHGITENGSAITENGERSVIEW